MINRVAQNRAAVVGYHRFVNNEKVNYERIMEGHYRHVARRSVGKELICIQDTCELNYHSHKGIIKPGELGTISDNKSLGLRVHPMLVLDAADEFSYGFSSLQIVNRAGKSTTRHERDYQSLPIEEKESYRWLSSIEQTKARLKDSDSLTIVADRESDIYQLWSRVPDRTTHLVIRSSFKRIFLDKQEQEVIPTNRSSLLGNYQIYVPGKVGKRDKGRQVDLEIFAQQAFTLKPRRLRAEKGNNDADRIPLYIVTAREVIKKGDAVEEPIEWILLTDLTVENLQQAIKIISIYKMRWNIEQVFRLTKQKGFGIEESQLATAHGLQNLIALVYIAAVRIYQMVKSRTDQNRPGADIFEEEQMKILDKIGPGFEGKTTKSKNLYRPGSLAYYAWVIARLGNWKSQDKDPPGPITFKRGWEVFENYLKINQLIT